MDNIKQLRRELSQRFHETQDLLGETAFPTSHDLADKVKADYPTLVSRLLPLLGDTYLYSMAGDCLRSATLVPSQFKLPFSVKNAPGWISFQSREKVDGKSVTVIRHGPLKRMTEVHLKSHAKILRKGIADDTARLDATEVIVDFFADIFKEFPGISVESASEIYRERGGDDNQPPLHPTP
jgi:hypothetical protein